MKDCSEYWERISAALDGALTPEEQTELEQHLKECPDCRQLYEDLSRMGESLSELEEPGPDLEKRVMARVNRTEQQIPFTVEQLEENPVQRSQRKVRAWWKPIVTIAACCVLVLGAGSFLMGNFLRCGSAGPGENSGEATAPEMNEPMEGAQDQSMDAVVNGTILFEGRNYMATGELYSELPEGFARLRKITAEETESRELQGRTICTNPTDTTTIFVEEGTDTYSRWVRN